MLYEGVIQRKCHIDSVLSNCLSKIRMPYEAFIQKTCDVNSLYRRSAIICFEVILVINASGLGKSNPMNITWVNGSSMYLEFLRT
jgi:hypothetical protein